MHDSRIQYRDNHGLKGEYVTLDRPYTVTGSTSTVATLYGVHDAVSGIPSRQLSVLANGKIICILLLDRAASVLYGRYLY